MHCNDGDVASALHISVFLKKLNNDTINFGYYAGFEKDYPIFEIRI